MKKRTHNQLMNFLKDFGQPQQKEDGIYYHRTECARLLAIFQDMLIKEVETKGKPPKKALKDSIFEAGGIYLIFDRDRPKRFKYRGKNTSKGYYIFESIENPADIQEVSIFAGKYLYEIQRNKVG